MAEFSARLKFQDGPVQFTSSHVSAAFGLQICPGEAAADVGVTILDKELSASISKCIDDDYHPGRSNVEIQEMADNSEIVVSTEGDKVIFDVTDKTCHDLGFRLLLYTYLGPR